MLPLQTRAAVSSLLIGLAALTMALFSSEAAGKKLVLFAIFTADTPVQLADGAKWMMDKGDSFPVLMFKDQQTKVMLQLAGTNFVTDAANVRIVEGSEVTDEILAGYRRNVVNYLEGRAKKWREEAKATDAPARSPDSKAFAQ